MADFLQSGVIIAPACQGLLTLTDIKTAGCLAAIDTYQLWQNLVSQMDQRVQAGKRDAPGTAQLKLPPLTQLSGGHGPVVATDPLITAVNGANRRGVKQDVVRFRNTPNGSLQALKPTEAVALQEQLAVDLVTMPSQQPAYFAPKDLIDAAASRTAAWTKQALSNVDQPYALVWQGAGLWGSRQAAWQRLTALGATPQAIIIGGIFQDEPLAESKRLLGELVPVIKATYPQARTLIMAPADADQVRLSWQAGVDLVMTALPTKLALAGQVVTADGIAPLKTLTTARLATVCQCPTCLQYPAKVVQTMVAADYPVGRRLLALHNLWMLGKVHAEPNLLRLIQS